MSFHAPTGQDAVLIVNWGNSTESNRWIQLCLEQIAGIWRNEMVPASRPHIHHSCLCTTVGFIEQHRLRFDFDCMHSKEHTHTFSHFTWIAKASGFSTHRLLRSNQKWEWASDNPDLHREVAGYFLARCEDI